MSEIVDIKEAREIMVKSESFSLAIKKVNDAILASSDAGIANTCVTFSAREMLTYEAVASFLEVEGYEVEVVRELGPECSIIISWYFDRWKED